LLKIQVFSAVRLCRLEDRFRRFAELLCLYFKIEKGPSKYVLEGEDIEDLNLQLQIYYCHLSTDFFLFFYSSFFPSSSTASFSSASPPPFLLPYMCSEDNTAHALCLMYNCD
jgi:hypothetical protein